LAAFTDFHLGLFGLAVLADRFRSLGVVPAAVDLGAGFGRPDSTFVSQL
jgi:hypothetical protein